MLGAVSFKAVFGAAGILQRGDKKNERAKKVFVFFYPVVFP